MCPHCHRAAPLVYRSGVATCSGCGLERLPLSQPSVNLAGRPQKVSGAVLRWLGVAVVLGGLLLASGVSLFVFWLFASLAALKFFGLPVAALSLILGVILRRAGAGLGQVGEAEERQVRVKALRALAAQRGGVLTAAAAARGLLVPEAEADHLLTEMAKAGDGVAVDLSDDGEVLYRMESLVPAGSAAWERRRVAVVEGPRVRAPGEREIVDEIPEEEVLAARRAAR
jgi:hypothetical protein